MISLDCCETKFWPITTGLQPTPCAGKCLRPREPQMTCLASNWMKMWNQIFQLIRKLHVFNWRPWKLTHTLVILLSPIFYPETVFMCPLILFRRQFKVCFQLLARLCHGYSMDEKTSFSTKFSFACIEFLASVFEGKGEMISFVQKT